MTAIDDINALDWPQDMNAQGGVMLQLLSKLNALTAEWGTQIHATLQINQPNPPTTADWQSLWVAEGHTLPIPLGTRLLWYNTTQQAFGGYFIVSQDGAAIPNLVIVRAENISYPGKSSFMPWQILATASLAVNNANLDLVNPVTIVLTRPAYVIMKLIGAVFSGAPGAEPVFKMFYKINGVDYLVNSAGSRPGLIAWLNKVNAGANTWNNRQLIWMHPDQLAAGTYLFDFWGYTNDSHTIALGERNVSSSSPILPAISWEILSR